MAQHNDFGKLGEEIAAGWLTDKGFSILHRNWRHGRSEVDIIAIRQKTYHFIEIKCSQGNTYGFPEERISRTKLRSVMRGAAHWLHEHHISPRHRVQYDVLAIQWLHGVPQYFFIEDVSL